MSTPFYDLASLVVVPSGYKSGKVYAQKPLTTDGQLTFTRASSATRVASNGLIEKVRTNVVTYSQDFSDASWTKTALTISTSATANPVNGALTAQDAIPTAVSSSHRIFKLAGVISTANTWSIFAKAKGYNFITIAENGNTSASVSFNLSTGAVSTQISAVGQIQSLGDGWYRCSMIHTTLTTPRFDVYVSPTDSLASYTGDGTSGVTLFGAQAEASDFGPTPYIATTTAAVSVGPVSGLPRLDYLNSTCPRLLLEPQRTNLFNFSEQIDNAYWTKTNSTITANSVTSPDGYANADTVTASGSGSITHVITRNITTTSGSVYAFSVFVKKGNTDFIALRHDNGGTFNYFNINTGTKGATCDASATIENYGNGWYRCSVLHTATGSNGGEVYLATANGVVSFAAAGQFAYIYGAQYELGAYATSYIPTLSASVTRVADTASKTGISSLIGQTEGVLFLDFEIQTTGQDMVIMNIYNGTTPTNSMYFYLTTSNVLQAYVDNSGTVVTISSGVLAQGRHKAALAYKANDCAFYLNGSLVGVDVSNTIPTCNAFRLENYASTSIYQEKTAVSQALLFKTRLTNAQLAELTTL